jgi:hypothetical protein
MFKNILIIFMHKKKINNTFNNTKDIKNNFYVIEVSQKIVRKMLTFKYLVSYKIINNFLFYIYRLSKDYIFKKTTIILLKKQVKN